jgi:Tfp pilus assembly protein PilO
MGLQHAIGDMASVRKDAVASKEAAGSTSGLFGTLRGRLTCACSRVRRLGRRGPMRGRGTVWRISAIAILTYVVAVNLSYFFVLKPIWTRLDGLVEKKSVIQDFLVVRESSTALAGFKDALMRGDERMTVIGEIEQMAQDAGLRAAGEAALLPPKSISKKVTEYPMELKFRGTFHEAGQFLSLVEASPRCLVVTEVELAANGSGRGECDVAVVLGAASWEE